MTIELIKGIEVHEGSKNDISDIIGVLRNKVSIAENKFCDSWSCFNGTYQVGKEREFIKKMIEENPDRYEFFNITWYNSN